MQLGQLEGFLAIARSGSFTDAAQDLFITQPALTMRIKQLEAELGCSLFHRQSTGTMLTSLGHIFLPYAVQAVESLRGGRARVAAAMTEGAPNRLLIGCAHVASEYVLPQLIVPFSQQHRDTVIQVYTGRSEEVAALVLSGEIDLGITRRVPYAGLIERPLFTDELILVVPLEHPLSNCPAVSVRDLVNHKLILHDRYSVFEDVVGESFLALIRSLDVIEADSTATAKALMKQGLGVAVLPKVAVPELLTGTLLELPLSSSRALSYVEVMLKRPDGVMSAEQEAFETLLVRIPELFPLLRPPPTGSGPSPGSAAAEVVPGLVDPDVATPVSLVDRSSFR